MQTKKAVKEHTPIEKETIINKSHAVTASMVHAAGTLLPALDDDNP